MANESDGGAVGHVDIDALEDRDVRLGWVVEVNVNDVDLAHLRGLHFLSYRFWIIVAFLLVFLSN